MASRRRGAGPCPRAFGAASSSTTRQTCDRLGDVLDPVLAHRLEGSASFALIWLWTLRETQIPPGSASAFEAGGDVHAVAVDVVILDDDVAEVDADAERDAPVLGQLSLALGDAVLDRDRAFDGIDDARELDQGAVAHQLDDAAAVLGDQRLDEVLAQRLQARDRAGLVGRHRAGCSRPRPRPKSPRACVPRAGPRACLQPRRHNRQQSLSTANSRACRCGRVRRKLGLSRRAPGPGPRSDRPGPRGRPRAAAGRR